MSSNRLPEALPPSQVAPTLFGYTLYRVCLLLMYALFIALGLWAWLAARHPGGGPVGGLLIGIGALFGAGVVGSFFAPVRPWAWSLHATVICLGVPLVVTTPFAVLIGLAWLKPEVKEFFGIELARDDVDDADAAAAPAEASPGTGD